MKTLRALSACDQGSAPQAGAAEIERRIESSFATEDWQTERLNMQAERLNLLTALAVAKQPDERPRGWFLAIDLHR